MEPILLYGIPAGSSMGLVAALEWLGQPYALCRVDMLGDMREAAYARVNARHETPVLITHRGQPLTETMAIAGWIEARDTGRVLSFDPGTPEAERMHQLMAYVNTGFTSAFGPLWTVMEMQQPAPPYQAALRRHGLAAVIERHDKLEAMAGEGPYLLGQHRTLADAVFVGVARWLELHDVADPAALAAPAADSSAAGERSGGAVCAGGRKRRTHCGVGRVPRPCGSAAGDRALRHGRGMTCVRPGAAPAAGAPPGRPAPRP
jgi:glutathione S-transferase